MRYLHSGQQQQHTPATVVAAAAVVAKRPMMTAVNPKTVPFIVALPSSSAG